MNNEIKYLFLVIQSNNIEYEYLHKVALETKCKNIDFAVDWYLAHFYLNAEYDKFTDYWTNNEIFWKKLKVIQIPKSDYDLLKTYI